MASFNWWLILCPSTISHDWQMGSIPLLTSISDPRNLLTVGAFIAAILLLYRGLLDFEVNIYILILFHYKLIKKNIKLIKIIKSIRFV